MLTAVIAALTIVGGAMPMADASPAVTARKGEPVSETVRVASYNAGVMVKPRGTLADVTALMEAGVDVIALQEASSGEKRKAIREQLLDCETCLYDGWMPTEAVPGGQPILYRSDRFTLVDEGMVEVSPATFVGSRGAGPSTIRAKWVTWVRLKSVATGRPFWVLNNHAVPTVQRGDGRPNTKLIKRVRLYRQHMEGLTALIDELRASAGGAIYVLGDLNVNYRTDSVVAPTVFPYYTMTQAGLTSTYGVLGMPEHGTHVLPNGFDKRLIDYGYYLPKRWMTPTVQNVLEGYRSDHRPLVVDYTLFSRGCFVQHENVCLTPPAE